MQRRSSASTFSASASARRFDDQLVVHLQNQLRGQAGFQLIVDGVHRDLDDIRRAPCTGVFIAALRQSGGGCNSGCSTPAADGGAVHRDGIAFRLPLTDARFHKPMDRRIAGKIARDKFRRPPLREICRLVARPKSLMP